MKLPKLELTWQSGLGAVGLVFMVLLKAPWIFDSGPLRRVGIFVRGAENPRCNDAAILQAVRMSLAADASEAETLQVSAVMNVSPTDARANFRRCSASVGSVLPGGAPVKPVHYTVAWVTPNKWLDWAASGDNEFQVSLEP